MKEKTNAILRALLHAVSQNLGWKIFSLAAAILLWSYIVTSDPTITRDKAISDVEITVSGQSVLQSRDLALLTDPSVLDVGAALAGLAAVLCFAVIIVIIGKKNAKASARVG